MQFGLYMLSTSAESQLSAGRSAMEFLEQGMSPDMEKAYNGFIAQRMVDEENQSGKVNKALDYNAATGDMKKGMFDARAKEWAKYKSFDATVVI